MGLFSWLFGKSQTTTTYRHYGYGMSDPRNPVGFYNPASPNYYQRHGYSHGYNMSDPRNPFGWTNMNSPNNPFGWNNPASPNYMHRPMHTPMHRPMHTPVHRPMHTPMHRPMHRKW